MPPAIIGAAISAIGSIAAARMARPDAPKEAKVTPMPRQGMEDAARRKSILEQQQRQGRASTILTDNTSTTLG